MKIEINNLSKKFKDTTILDNINLSMNSGKIYGLVGANGSGKSVLLKMICSFFKPTSGEVLINGINYNNGKDFPPNIRAFIEKPSFLPDLTGLQNLQLLANIQNKAKIEDIDDALKKVNLYSEKDKVFHKYSMGMKQKLGIASVLMEDPEIMILDEPFNGIERETKEKLYSVIKELKREKIIIISSHISDEIKNLCDEVYSIEEGKIIKES